MKSVVCLTFIALVAAAPGASAQQTGTITGRVTDSQTGEPLPGANIRVVGTAMGTATGLDGSYDIRLIPAGPRALIATYIGYEPEEVSVDVSAGETIRQDFALRFGLVEGEEIVITAQLEGQASAINQQLSSNTIVNVVSSDRIQELPDQNAAESIGRLPGIAVQRDAGEGQKIVVRGLSPKFNSITVNGERIPSTDPQDRSVDLSMISPDVLAGIEVFKALTPDKDADAIGGTVNLVMRKAPAGFRSNVRLQTGYNAHQSEFGQYKGSLSLSGRSIGGRLGMLVTGSLQRADRSSDLFTSDYVFRREGRGEETRAVIGIENVNLADRIETRDRMSASVALDFDLPGGSLLLRSFLARTDRDELRLRKRYRVGATRTEYDLLDRQRFTNLYTNALSGNHALGPLEVDWQASHSYSLLKTPFSNYARFQEVGAYLTGLVDDQGPAAIPQYARNDLESTWFQYGTFNPDRTRDRDMTGSLNATMPLSFGPSVAGFVKFGAKHRDKKRNTDANEFRTDFGVIDSIGQANSGNYDLYRDRNIKINNFIDSGYSSEGFLDGSYAFGPGLHRGMLNDFYATFEEHYESNRFIELGDYEAGERVSAAYFMTELHLGSRLMLLPGVRYERTTNDYRGNAGSLRGNLGQQGAIQDTTGGQEYGELLPMAHVRYRFTDWLDVRLATTRTLSRPDYFNLVPFERINDAEQIIDRGNPLLKHTKAWNFDVFVSIYSNRLGLLTLGGFFKQLSDIDYLKRNFRVVGGQFNGYTITEPTNADETTVYGAEVDLQTNFSFLPGPLGGIVLYANYAYIFSETFFPFFEIGPRSPDPPFQPTVIDTVRRGRMPGQADHIANLAVGYERGGFSGRLSMVYQGESLQIVGTRSELDGYTDAYARWDLSVTQRLGFVRGLRVFFNINNLTNRPEAAYLGTAAFPTNQEFFGWTADFGVQYSF